jgi:integrase
MSKLIEKHDISDGLYIYLQDNSNVWIARFKVGGRWLARTTREREKKKALTAAIKIQTECEILARNGIALQSKAFKHVAQLAIERMDQQTPGSRGYATLNDYKLVLNRYHIPFFDRLHITSIDQQKLSEFDAWRTNELGRVPAQSTMLTHNAALQRVFDEAVLRKWVTHSQLPNLSVKGGVAAHRRDYFTAAEVDKIAKAFKPWIARGRTQLTRDTRELLYAYFQVAVHTGLRPGSEMDNLRWNDVELKDDHVLIRVRKGKTTLYTGNRICIGHTTVLDMILDMHEKSSDHERLEEIPDDYNPLVFRLRDGSTTTQLGRNFTMLLRELGLAGGADGVRTLYSLRHTYISLRLLEGVSPTILGKQCGTSPEMIQRHYDHLTTQMHVKELVGSEGAELTKLIKAYASLD